MLFHLEDIDKNLFLCTESMLSGIKQLGLGMQVLEKNTTDVLMFYGQPTRYFMVESEEDKTLLKLTYKSTKLGFKDLKI